MPAYIIVEIDIVDPVGYEEYKKLAKATVDKYGGKYIVRGGKTEVLEGDWKPKRIVVLEFESAAPRQGMAQLRRVPRTAQDAASHSEDKHDLARRPDHAFGVASLTSAVATGLRPVHSGIGFHTGKTAHRAVATATAVLRNSRQPRVNAGTVVDRLRRHPLAKPFGVAIDEGMIRPGQLPSRKIRIAFALGLLRISPFVCDCCLK